MAIATENLIRALSLSSGEAIFGELNLIKHALEKLFEADEARISKEELFNNVLKIVKVSERIKEAATPRQKFDIYYSEYRPLSDEFSVKYSDFLARDTFREIQAYEKYVDGLKELVIVQGIMLLGFEETDRTRQCEKLYTGMVRLSELIEEYFIYFPQELIEYIKDIASAFLNDAGLRPDGISQDKTVFSYLIGLKNTARAILWQVEEQQVKSRESHLASSLAMNLDLARELQIQRNQAAMDWARSQLEQIESIRKEKGHTL
jgi:hypothetical protein